LDLQALGIAPGPWGDKASLGQSCGSEGCSDPHCDGCREAHERALNSAMGLIRPFLKERSTENLVQAYRVLVERYGAPPPPPPPEETTETSWEPIDWEPSDKMEAGPSKELEETLSDRSGKAVQPGIMTIETPDLVRPIGVHRSQPRWGAAREGVFPRYPGRLLSDGAVFARKRRVPGGTVLIDASGSMNLTHAQVKAIVEKTAGATVAVYLGTGDDMTGVLRIVAKRGRMAERFTGYDNDSSGNVVDVPALDWLCKQPKPRIWVCDGIVTGKGDRHGGNINRLCWEAVGRGRIFWAKRPESAVEILTKLYS
jgi:hypothetical protein